MARYIELLSLYVHATFTVNSSPNCRQSTFVPSSFGTFLQFECNVSMHRCRKRQYIQTAVDVIFM